MESRYLEDEKQLIFTITDEIDEHTVKKIRRRADYEIERYMPKKVLFNFHYVTFMDSAGIGMLIGRYKMVHMLGGTLEITNINKSLERILKMSGVLKLIPIVNYEEKVS